jgi:hypothetical protein
MSDKLTSYAILAGLGVLGAVGLWLYVKGPKAAASAVVSAADQLAAGTIEGVGSVLGIPSTDEDKCAHAMADGSLKDASFYCPAPTFLRWVMSGRPKALSVQLAGQLDQPNMPQKIYDAGEQVYGP